MMTEIPKLESDPEEIDTSVVLYCSYAVIELYCITMFESEAQIVILSSFFFIMHQK